MKTLIFALALILPTVAVAQTDAEVSSAYSSCTGVYAVCGKHPSPPECTPELVNSCALVKAESEKRDAARRKQSTDTLNSVVNQLKAKKQ